jgi:putative peptidoglycan lipid II flippase
VQTSDTGLTKQADRVQRAALSIGRGAALIAALTMLSRMLGLVRTLVYSQSIGSGCLGTAYVTAYQVPNLISELVLGGALTSAMVPVLARSAERAALDPGERARVGQISSALLTWSVVVLAPVTLAMVAVSGPVASLLIPANAHSQCVRADVVSATTGMLQAFAPQILLYGISVVLFGLLQAYRRFTGPALAPVVTSLVLISTYLVFVPLDKGLPLATTPFRATVVLSAGTTLSIAALVVVALPPVWRLRLRFRPSLRLPPELARLAGGMAAVGVIEFIANDLATVVIIALANGRGDTGAIVLFNYAWLVFNAVYAVLALSIVTSAFPVLSARTGEAFDRACAGSTRAVVLMACLGTAVMAAVAFPAAHVLVRQPAQVRELALAFVFFAPGVVGFAVVTNLSRAMFAMRRVLVPGIALTGTWLLVMAADAVLALVVPAHLVVPALALGSTLGQSLAAVPMVIVTRRMHGKATVAGVGRACAAGVVAGVVGAAFGMSVSAAVPVSGRLMNAGLAVVAAGCAVVAFGVIAGLLDRPDLRMVTARVGQRLARR